MKNRYSKYIILIVLAILIFIFLWLIITGKLNFNKTFSDIAGTRMSYQENSENNNHTNNNANSVNNHATAENANINKAPVETQISNISTPILDDSSGRVENSRITCNILNDTIINPGETFSFNEHVGQPSAERGYKEASIIVDGEHETGIGGGNCQVSSTIYDAVLVIPTLTIVERHEHGGDGVAYVEKGKDAAVSYGSLDLKFRNDNNYKIKLKLSTDDKNITASIYKIEMTH